MTTINQVAKGQSDWQENVNQTIQAVNGLTAGAEPTHLTNVFSYLNGVTGNGSEAWYWVIGGCKLVYLFTGSFQTPNGFQTDDVSMEVPDEIAPLHETNILVSRDDILINEYGATNKFHVFITNNTSSTKVTGIGSVFYLAKN